MNIALIMWLGEIADSINSLFHGYMVLSGVLIFISIFACMMAEEFIIKPYIKPWVIITIVVSVINILTPSSKVFYAYAAQEVATEIVKNPNVQELLKKTQQVIIKKLDSYLEEEKQTSNNDKKGA